MRVLMLGWEFPPHISGGLGTACYGMTKGLDEIGVQVCFVLPTAVPVAGPSHVQIRSASDLPRLVEGRVTRMFKHLEVHRVRAALHDLVLFYVNQLAARQIRFNEQTARALVAMQRDLEAEVRDLRARVASVEDERT